MFGGGGLTNEKAYQLGKFARLALGTSRIDYNGRFCMSSAAAAGMRAFGVDRGLPFPLEDLDAASTILMLGSNVAETMPPVRPAPPGCPRRRRPDRGGSRAAPPPRPSPPTAAACTCSPCPAPTSPSCWAWPTWSSTRAWRTPTTSQRAHHRLRRRWPAASPPSGPNGSSPSPACPPDLIRDTARRLADGATQGRQLHPHRPRRGAARGRHGHRHRRDQPRLLLGLPGSARSGYGTLTGQGNGQGGREHGQKADQLPGYRKITDPAARAHVATSGAFPSRSSPAPASPPSNC